MLSDRLELLTRDQVAERLQVSARTVDRYIASGELPIVRISGRLVRIESTALELFLQQAS